MIGISEDNLSFDVLAQFMLMHPFHRANCPDRHKNWRFYRAVIGVQYPSSRARFRVGMSKFKVHKMLKTKRGKDKGISLVPPSLQ
jgi:hypothetical protein